MTGLGREEIETTRNGSDDGEKGVAKCRSAGGRTRPRCAFVQRRSNGGESKRRGMEAMMGKKGLRRRLSNLLYNGFEFWGLDRDFEKRDQRDSLIDC